MVEHVFPDFDGRIFFLLFFVFFLGGGGDSKKRDNSKPALTKCPVSAEYSTEFWTNTLDQNIIRNISELLPVYVHALGLAGVYYRSEFVKFDIHNYHLSIFTSLKVTVMSR